MNKGREKRGGLFLAIAKPGLLEGCMTKAEKGLERDLEAEIVDAYLKMSAHKIGLL